MWERMDGIPCNNPSMLSLLGVGSGPLDDGENSLTRFMIFLSVPDCCPRNLVSDAAPGFLLRRS